MELSYCVGCPLFWHFEQFYLWTFQMVSFHEKMICMKFHFRFRGSLWYDFRFMICMKTFQIRFRGGAKSFKFGWVLFNSYAGIPPLWTVEYDNITIVLIKISWKSFRNYSDVSVTTYSSYLQFSMFALSISFSKKRLLYVRWLVFGGIFAPRPLSA